MRWGVTIPLEGIPLSKHGEMLRLAEEMGYTDFWTVEVDGLDAFVPAAVAATTTERAHIGTAIANIYTRGPALLAMSAAAVAEAAPGRFILGLGVSTQVIVERWNGGRVEQPLARMREMVRFLRSVWAGERASSQLLGVQGFRLSRRLASPPPIFVAALREGMLRLAGEVADGVIINWLSPDDVPRVVAVAREGAARAGKDPQSLEVACRIFVLPPLPDGAIRAIGRRLMAAYLTVPVYAQFHAWLGREEVIRPMLQAWQAGDRQGALELIPDSLLEELLVFGSRQECLDKIEAYCRQGVTIPVLLLLAVGQTPQEQGEMALHMLKELARP